MRLVLVPLILAAILAVGPTAVHANGNQAAAEKIAASLGEKFPGYDIAVSYQNGKVRLVGQVGSPEIAQQVMEHVQKTPGVKVSNVDNGLRIANMGQPARVVPMSATVQAPQQEAALAPPKQKRSILTPPQTAQPLVASAPIPMPERQVVQVAAQDAVAAPQLAPIQSQQPVQPQQLMMVPQNGYQPEAYGHQAPMPGQYNHPNLPDYAWPSYACYPNYAEVCYPKQYSPKAWPYIGPFYPYPQAPLGWRKVTLEHHDGWWWLDFDDGTPSGPFSPLFRQPVRYTY